MKRKILILSLAAAMTAMMFGCGKEEWKAPGSALGGNSGSISAPEIPEEKEPEDVIPEGMARSYLTGEWIDEEIAKHRPYAVMIGNSKEATPQYGISKADVIYEAPVEGSYTRMMAIFQDPSGLERIGSVRSCRHYFYYFAREFDSIYAHYGQAAYALEVLDRSDVHNISGLDGSVETIAFYRGKDRKAPHNAYTSDEGLKAATEKKGYRTEYADTYQGHYQFAPDDAPEMLTEGTDALVVSPGYFVCKPWFVYNEDDGLYYRYEYGKEQIDGDAEEGNKQLAVKNILIQYCEWQKLDENDYLNVETIGSGTGKYITNGKVIDVTWKKDNEDSPARYYDKDGNEILMNQGKTWVCIVRNSYKDRFAVYDTQEELEAARNQQ